MECGGWLGRQGAHAAKGLILLHKKPTTSKLSTSRYQPVVHCLLQAKTSGRADSQHKRRMRDQVTNALKLNLFQNSTSQIVHSCYSAHVCKLQSNITNLYRHSFPRNAKALKPLSCPARSERESQIKNPISIRTHDIRQKITTIAIFAIAMKSEIPPPA